MLKTAKLPLEGAGVSGSALSKDESWNLYGISLPSMVLNTILGPKGSLTCRNSEPMGRPIEVVD